MALAHRHVPHPQFSLMIAYSEFKKFILHPVVLDGILMEVSLFGFFVVIYIVALNRYIPCIMWPISVSECGWWLRPK